MSRSIHSTRREVERLESFEYSRAEQREAVVTRARERLARKRRIKAAVLEERRRPAGGVTPASTIPVIVTETGAHIHHVATPDDVREVLRRLPPGAVDGLTRIELQLGAEYQLEHERKDPAGFEPDPLVGRVGFEGFPGVYSGRVLGTYHDEGAVVRVNAYVYEERAPLREVWELLLKLHALSTLVHEVGHHFDATMRVARGRWLADGDEHVEMYAEDRQHVWLHLAVLPYLRETYAAQVDRIEEWVHHYGGVRLPIETLAGDPRGTRKRGAINVNATLWSMPTLLEDLTRGVVKGEPLQTSRVGFARFLHYREDYVEALCSLDVVLAEEPGHVEALTLRADIYVHQGRYEEGLAIAREVVARVPEDGDAWEVVADACESLERWDEMRAAAERMVTLYSIDDHWRCFGALLQRAIAALRLGALSDARADLATIERDYPKRARAKRVRQLRAELESAESPRG